MNHFTEEIKDTTNAYRSSLNNSSTTSSVVIMLSQTLFKLASFAMLGATHPAAPPESLPLAINARSSQICYDSETPNLLCYNPPSGVPQNVALADVAYIAAYLRSYGSQTKAGRLFNMAAADAPDCGEWTLYARNSAIAIAKHIDNTVNSSVLFADIATTIDGGAKATPEQQAAALIGCGTSGGSLGVLVNASNPVYTASTYPTGRVSWSRLWLRNPPEAIYDQGKEDKISIGAGLL